jgi:hypothetical protein
MEDDFFASSAERHMQSFEDRGGAPFLNAGIGNTHCPAR